MSRHAKPILILFCLIALSSCATPRPELTVGAMSAEDLRLQLVRAIDANNEFAKGFDGVPPVVSYGAIDVVRNGSAFEVTLKDATYSDDYLSLPEPAGRSPSQLFL